MSTVAICWNLQVWIITSDAVWSIARNARQRRHANCHATSRLDAGDFRVNDLKYRFANHFSKLSCSSIKYIQYPTSRLVNQAPINCYCRIDLLTRHALKLEVISGTDKDQLGLMIDDWGLVLINKLLINLFPFLRPKISRLINLSLTKHTKRLTRLRFIYMYNLHNYLV